MASGKVELSLGWSICLITLIVAISIPIVKPAALPAPAEHGTFLTVEIPRSRGALAPAYFGSLFKSRVGGGVVFVGDATFSIVQNNAERSLDSSNLLLVPDNANNVYISFGAERYKIEIHRDLVCPLGKFIARDGQIAFAIPHPTVRDEELQDYNLRRVTGQRSDRRYLAAPEFVDTRFVRLLYASDFASTVPLGELGQRLTNAMNSAVDQSLFRARSRSSEMLRRSGWFTNADFQTTYRVRLDQNTGLANISGVPLRYFWSFAEFNTALIDRIEAFRQVSPGDGPLADGEDFRQYDYVVLYQAAGVFRHFAVSHMAMFAKFVDAACRY